jgi:hypothetical protein
MEPHGDTRRFEAPMGRTIVWVSIVVCALAVALYFALGSSARLPGAPWLLRWLRVLPMATVAVTALFAVRGYGLTREHILVHRPLWTTRLPRTGVVSVEHQAHAMRGSLRLFGIGGLFGVSGWFSSRALGRYRAFVSDPERTVIVRWADRVVVISPSPPESFVAALREPPA